MRIYHIQPKIHWRRYLERKVFILVGVVVGTYLFEIHTHTHVAVVSRAHELTLSVLFEHLFFGIPFGGD